MSKDVKHSFINKFLSILNSRTGATAGGGGGPVWALVLCVGFLIAFKLEAPAWVFVIIALLMIPVFLYGIDHPSKS